MTETKVCTHKLVKVQILTFLSTTGAMGTKPTAAIENRLDLYMRW